MINALDQTGLAYFWSKITGRLATKADLVNGKVPVSQLPSSGGGDGFEPTVISCTLDFADVAEDGRNLTWQEQLASGSYTAAVTALGAGTPAILKASMQETTVDETTGESTVTASVANDDSLQCGIFVSEPTGDVGDVSWNDLTDKPFSETNHVAETYTMPDMATTAYNAATFHYGSDDINLRLYRVGDALPVGALIGGDVSYVSPLASDTATIVANNIRASTDGVAYVVKPSNVDFPAVCVCFADGETVEIDMNDGISFLGTIAQAGTYLIWGDLSILAAGATYYVGELNTVDFADIQQLDQKFYKQSVHIIAATTTIQNIVSAFSTGTAVTINMESGTTTQALNAFAKDAQVIVAFTLTDASTQTVVLQSQFILSQFDSTTNALSADVAMPWDLQYVGLPVSVPCDMGYKIVLSNDVLVVNWRPEKSTLVLRLSSGESLGDDVTIGGVTVADIKERSQLTYATVKYPIYSSCTEAQTQAILLTGFQLGWKGAPITVGLDMGGTPPQYLYAHNVTLANDIVCEFMGGWTILLVPLNVGGSVTWVVVSGSAS